MPEPLRILIVIDNFHPLLGGAEHAALESGRALVRRGHRVDVLTMRKSREWPQEERIGDIRVVRFDERIPPRPFGRFLYERWNARAARRCLDRQLAGEPYDVLMLHPIAAAFGVAESRSAARASVIYCFHAPLGLEHVVATQSMAPRGGSRLCRWTASFTAAYAAHCRARQQRAAIERADAVTCPSDYSRELLAYTGARLGDKPVRVIPWGVDAERFRPAADRAALRARLGWADDDLVLLTVRRMVPRMGLGELIHGFGVAAARNPRLRLVVGGDGPLRSHLEEISQSVGGRVAFLGLVPPDDLPAYLQAADLFLLPSITLEAFGLVTLEALACGTPVLATKRCATPEILAPLDGRLLIPGTDAAAISDAILGNGLQAATEPGFRSRCRAYVTEHYSWDRTAAAFEELMHALRAGTHSASNVSQKASPIGRVSRRGSRENGEKRANREEGSRG